MLDIKELDLFNLYNANLDDIVESSKRTYGEAVCFFDMAETKMISTITSMHDNYFPTRAELYDIVNSVASILAASCEMFLKALYLYEHRSDGVSAEVLWDNLRKPEYKMDSFGHYIYEQTLPSGEVVRVMACVDQNGAVIKNSAGRMLYQDEYGNQYVEGAQGKKIKMNGHDLDRLINMLSVESRFMLESRMTSINMKDAMKNTRVSLVDWLEAKNLVSRKEKVSRCDYLDWVDKHKKTFEESRYAGQTRRSVSIEFLYHLATQIKAVAQYKLAPTEKQNFVLSDEELSKQPEEIQMLADENPKLITERLVKAIASDDSFRKKFQVMMKRKYRFDMTSVSASTFYHALSECSEKELTDIATIGYLRSGKIKLRLLNFPENNDAIRAVRGFMDFLDDHDVDMNTLIMYYIDLKRLGFEEVRFNDFKTLIQYLFDKYNDIERQERMENLLNEDNFDDVVNKFMLNIKDK